MRQNVSGEEMVNVALVLGVAGGLVAGIAYLVGHRAGGRAVRSRWYRLARVIVRETIEEMFGKGPKRPDAPQTSDAGDGVGLSVGPKGAVIREGNPCEIETPKKKIRQFRDGYYCPSEEDLAKKEVEEYGVPRRTG